MTLNRDSCQTLGAPSVPVNSHPVSLFWHCVRSSVRHTGLSVAWLTHRPAGSGRRSRFGSARSRRQASSNRDGRVTSRNEPAEPLPRLPELRKRGFKVLVRELGAANALRFLHLCGTGHGDYTRDRDRWLSRLTIEQIEEKIRQPLFLPHRFPKKALPVGRDDQETSGSASMC